MNITIVSDDITGAIDSSSFALASGSKVRVETFYQNEIRPHQGKETISINMASRMLSGPASRECHRAIAERMRDFPDQLFIKKIDTGFRGNAAFEIEGTLQGLKKNLCFVLDHSPVRNTFTLYGHQYVDGVILTKSVFAKEDPIKRPKESYIPSIISEHTSLRVGLIDIDTVKGSRLVETVQEAVRNGYCILIFDVICDFDCQKIIRLLSPAFPDTLWCGSLGLIWGMADYIYGQPVSAIYQPDAGLRSIAFTASAYQIVQKQITMAQERGLEKVILDMDRVINGDDQAVEEAISHCLDVNRTGNFILVPQLSPDVKHPNVSNIILDTITRCAKRICTQASFDRLVIVGGETSYSIVQAIGATKIHLTEKPETGVGIGIIEDGLCKGKSIATKGGSIGSLLAICRMLGYPE